MKSLLPPELQAKWDVRDTVPRRDRLRELAFAGYSIPRCGVFADMVRLGVPLVVYTDEMAHCGEGKVLWGPGDTVGGWPKSAFCSEYVPDDQDDQDDETAGTVHSHRELVVGRYRFILDYRSSGSWKSNVGGDYELVSRIVGLRPRDDLMPYPMYGVDYTDHHDRFNHFDLNTCPGVPLEVVNLVGRDALTTSVADFCREWGLI